MVGPWDLSTTVSSTSPEMFTRNPAAGRRRVIEMIDMLIGDPINVATLRSKLQAEFERDPIGFFQKVVMPLVPKDIRVDASISVNTVAAGIIEAMANDPD